MRIMKKLMTEVKRLAVAAVAGIVCATCAWGADAPTAAPAARPLKVLMIGNSYSQSVLTQTPAIAKAMGLPLDIANLYIGGCPLSRHWQNVEKAGDATFLPYAVNLSWTSCKEKDSALRRVFPKWRGNIPAALAAEPWDIVTIQQASGESAFYERYQPYASNLVALVRRLAPQAEIRIHETWSYSPYDARLAKWNLTPETMYARLHDAYARLARDAGGLRIIPVGTAVQNYRQALPVRYEKLLSQAELDALQPPALPSFFGDLCGSARWVKDRKAGTDRLSMDPFHLNRVGAYLQGCVWVASLFGADVTKCAYRPDFLSEEQAALLRKVAFETVKAGVEASSR